MTIPKPTRALIPILRWDPNKVPRKKLFYSHGASRSPGRWADHLRFEAVRKKNQNCQQTSKDSTSRCGLEPLTGPNKDSQMGD